MKPLTLLIGVVFLAFLAMLNAEEPARAASQTEVPPHSSSSLDRAPETIPVETVVTMQNWQQYRQFMPDGMIALFEGRYFWKMPANVAMESGPTVIHPLPIGYREATEKFAAQVRLVHEPNGETELTGYRGGQPFPNPSGPDRGWEVLANLWFRYLPHLFVDTEAAECLQNHYGNLNCSADEIIYRQLNYNTDPGVSASIPDDNKYFTEWIMKVLPENKKYTASLSITHNDVTEDQDSYVFLPALRRYQRVSASARCGSEGGTDVTPDDYRFGFNGVIGHFGATFLGEGKILALTDFEIPKAEFPGGFDMPLGWPTPSWGKWQLRDVDILDVRKIPSMSAGYCYGKRVMYVDQQFNAPLWEELYDSNMNLWKIMAIFTSARDAPAPIGTVNSSGSQVEAIWDIKNDHATYFIDPADGAAFYLNEQVPKQFDDIAKYSTPGGLNEIMR